jgi:putative metal-binding protein
VLLSKERHNVQHTHTKPFAGGNRGRWGTPLRVARSVLIGFALGSMLLLWPSLGSTRLVSRQIGASPTPTPTLPCVADRECSDGLWCNGFERCQPDSALADSRGCVPALAPACSARLACDEDQDRCVNSCNTDADHDHHIAANCGGDDCDDHDARRHPGAVEVCDAEGRDEDCNPLTYGHRDVDGDGEDDFRCFNRAANGTFNRGTDYDDNNPAIRLGSMICDGPDAVVVSGSSSVPCPTGTKCVVQPNKTGICIVPPAGYVPSGRFVPPPPPPERAGLPALTALRSFENTAPIRPGGTGLTSAKQASTSSVAVAAPVVRAETDSAGGSAAEVAECKSTLQAGKVSWGGGTAWAPANIDKLCNGTTNAKKTIACFETNVAALGWAAAIDKCR